MHNADATQLNSFLAIHNNCCQLAHTLVAYILNNMNPDQTPPLGHSDQFWQPKSLI